MRAAVDLEVPRDDILRNRRDPAVGKDEEPQREERPGGGARDGKGGLPGFEHAPPQHELRALPLEPLQRLDQGLHAFGPCTNLRDAALEHRRRRGAGGGRSALAGPVRRVAAFELGVARKFLVQAVQRLRRGAARARLELGRPGTRDRLERDRDIVARDEHLEPGCRLRSQHDGVAPSSNTARRTSSARRRSASRAASAR